MDQKAKETLERLKAMITSSSSFVQHFYGVGDFAMSMMNLINDQSIAIRKKAAALSDRFRLSILRIRDYSLSLRLASSSVSVGKVYVINRQRNL